MTIHKLVPLFLVLALSVPAFAQQGGGGLEGNRYLEGSVGFTVASMDLLGIEETDISGAAINANGGWYFHRHFAVEGGYSRYFAEDDALNSLHLAVKGTLQFGPEERLLAFAKLGPALYFADGHSDGWFFGGIGVGYSITPELDVLLQLQGTTTAFFGVGMVTVGLGYHF